jgi:hypothetical protein
MRINNVREMLKMRLRNDPLARSSGIDPDGLDDRMIDALPVRFASAKRARPKTWKARSRRSATSAP